MVELEYFGRPLGESSIPSLITSAAYALATMGAAYSAEDRKAARRDVLALWAQHYHSVCGSTQLPFSELVFGRAAGISAEINEQENYLLAQQKPKDTPLLHALHVAHDLLKAVQLEAARIEHSLSPRADCVSQ